MDEPCLDPFAYPPPLLKTDSQYVKTERLKHVAWLAAHGSTSVITRLERMADENKYPAWHFSTADIKTRLKAVLNAPDT
jgi:hypothetical protein